MLHLGSPHPCGAVSGAGCCHREGARVRAQMQRWQRRCHLTLRGQPCPRGEWYCAKAPGHSRPLAQELTKQHCSSLWDWKQLPVGRR